MVRKMILCCILSALMLSGCTSAFVDPAETCPGHTPASSGWSVEEHWDVCACGARFNVHEHIMGLKNRCVVCNIIVVHHDWGTTAIRETDAQGNEIHEIVYQDDGTIVSESWTEYALDHEGNYYPCSYHFIDSVTESWVEYEPNQPGSDLPKNWHATRAFDKYADGKTWLEEYDSNGKMILQEIYEPKEKLTTSVHWEFDDDGRELSRKEYHNGKLVREITEYIEWVDASINYTFRYPEVEINYQEDGTGLVTYYAYFDDGSEKSETTYDGERLVREVKYTENPYGSSGPDSITEYHADGTKTVIAYDADGNILETTYDANGNVIG